MIRPHDYQADSIARVRAAYLRGRRAPCLVLPCGGGKTIVAAFIILAAIQRGTRILFVADRCTLIDQTVAKLALVGVTGVRIIQAARDTGPSDALVTVASAQTLRLRAELPEADLVIWDEVHHVIADTYAATVARYPAAKFLGLTATPCRGDNRPLDICDELVVGATIRQLTELGHLARCRVIAPDRELEPGQIAQSPLDAWRKQAGGRRAAVFWARVDEATKDAEAFRAAGISAEVITAKTRNRADILARFARGEIQILESVGTLTEGWDDKECCFAIVARRPQYVGMWLQICGRVLRAAPGKTHGIISDLRGTVWDPDFGRPDQDREYSLDGKGIRPVIKDAIRHCSRCGSIADLGPRACPFCGTEYPVRPRAMARVVGAEMAEVGEERQPPKPMRPRPIASKHGGHCRKCGRWFPAGTPIWWAKGRPAQHQQCPPPSIGVAP